MFPRWGACPLRQRDFLHNIVYLNINFQFRLQLSKMYCSAPKWGQEQPFLFFCLDFFHHTVDNRDRHSAHDSPAIDHWCSWLPKHGVRRGHLSARIHLCPLQQHDDNRIFCCELDYELSGLQSAHDTNTDMIQTEPLKVGVCGRHSYTLHKIQTGKMSQCQRSTLKRH